VCVSLGGEEDREKAGGTLAAGFWGESAKKGEIALDLGLCFVTLIFSF